MKSRAPLVVGLSGSPRRKGNSEILLDRFLSGAREAGAGCAMVVLEDLSISPCRECARVNRDGTCLVEDDFQDLYRSIIASDILVLAAPVFFGSLPARVKAVVDRFQCHWLAREVFRTLPRETRGPAFFLSAQATARHDFFRNSRQVAGNFFAAAGFGPVGELACYELEEAGAVSSRPDCLEKAFRMGGEAVVRFRSDFPGPRAGR